MLLYDADADAFAKLISLVASNEITSRVAKDLLQEVAFEAKDPKELAHVQNK